MEKKNPHVIKKHTYEKKTHVKKNKKTHRIKKKEYT